MPEPVLELAGLASGYGPVGVVRDLGLVIREGELAALLGPNGAGKTCALLTIAGPNRASAGTIRFDGIDVTAERTRHRARRGISLVPEGRQLFPALTVRENLSLAATSVGRPVGPGLEIVTELFPQLVALLAKVAGSLSGGEQQMCAIGRGIMAGPRLLMIDELSLGLAPVVVERLVEALRRANDELGMTVLFVEQDADLAIETAERIVVLSMGRKVFDGSAGEATASRDLIEQAYLGLPTGT